MNQDTKKAICQKSEISEHDQKPIWFLTLTLIILIGSVITSTLLAMIIYKGAK